VCVLPPCVTVKPLMARFARRTQKGGASLKRCRKDRMLTPPSRGQNPVEIEGDGRQRRRSSVPRSRDEVSIRFRRE
jgi:hypothetical protein